MLIEVQQLHGTSSYLSPAQTTASGGTAVLDTVYKLLSTKVMLWDIVTSTLCSRYHLDGQKQQKFNNGMVFPEFQEK